MLLSSLLFAANVSADERPSRVVVTYVGGDADALRAAVDELLAKLHVVEESGRVATLELRDVVTPQREGASVAHAWIDLRDAGRAKLYVVDPARERVLVREVTVEPGHEELAREEVAQILEAAVETLLSGGQIGRPREEVRTSLGVAPPAPPPPPVAPPLEKSRGPSFALGVFWQGELFSNEVLVSNGPGAFAELALGDGSARPSIRLGGHYRLPISATGPDAALALDAAGARLSLGITLRSSARLRFSFLLGGGVDFVHVSPTAGIPATALDPARWTVVPLLEPLAGARYGLTSAVGLELDLGADVELSRTSYYVSRQDQRDVILDPWTVRPSLRLGVVLEPGGAP